MPDDAGCGSEFCLGFKSRRSQHPDVIAILSEEWARVTNDVRANLKGERQRKPVLASEASARLIARAAELNVDLAYGHKPEGQVDESAYCIYLAELIDHFLQSFLAAVDGALMRFDIAKDLKKRQN